MSSDSSGRWLCVLIAALCAGVFLYSQFPPLDWDEGFHLVAASLIAAGKRPYIDFCFPQPSLHAWWNAMWLNLTGGGWRGPHAAAALLTCLAISLSAESVYSRFSVPGSRVVAAAAAALLAGLNSVVFEFGTKAQAYGACTFLTIAAFRAAIAPPALLRTVISGCLAGAAAAGSLLTAPVCLVLFIRILRQRPPAHVVAFAGGMMLPFLPVLISFLNAPYLTWFNLVEYHVIYRRVGWTGATENDLRVLTAWTSSGPALLITIFAAAGLYFVHRTGRSAAQKADFKLAGWIVAALGAEAAIAHPTFRQYFIFIVPFLAILAAAGFCEILSRLSLPPRWAVTALAAVLVLSLWNSLLDVQENNNSWTGMESLAKKIDQVTPANTLVLADPPVYFAMRRQPPSGMEFPASHTLEFPPEKARLLHIVPNSLLQKRVRAGEFATVETCKGDEEEVRALMLPRFYSNKVTISDCDIYWGFRRVID